ncbi:HTTM domain-containing protein [Polyangium jinanense]|uniref:HTTM domain-containing protein n=1 Tax=Polyangium jinanense TaxID=2829994 RepID=A0A9X3WY76_9BACT|nr:HTTM domain-containing protein [Polyangium jinanense]MDC3953945.1 HTTM domain-containing protein [Polyangium jinanense]MDC3957842.1 HTTM domain-containing protein [Polyangium jinanense]MDC3978928.1 HTTM domain-containing protein [Polyangium jinanense]MDC3982099.1 HTTM domain-containing protein [Polyangium jinanense]
MTERAEAVPPGRLARLASLLLRPEDAAALAAFRFCFGVLGCVSAIRFLAYGWVDEFFVKPRFFLSYWGFDWLAPLSARGMHALFVALAVVSACVAVGFLYRAAIVLFLLGFTYVQLLDVTNYLNHYYLVSLLALLLSFMPLHRAYSVDAWLFPKQRSATLPAWCTYLLRVQVGAVYFFAGLAKVNSDWLLHAQPLNIWLSSRTYLPIIGPLLGERWVAFAMSWAGCLFDLTVVAFLLTPRTRVAAYAVVLFFHGVTKLLFPIGMFPAIMVVAALVFFSPSWPRNLARFFRRRASAPAPALPAPAAAPLPRFFGARVAVAACYCAFQLLWPLRTHLYGGNVLWHEQGIRFSWRVMLREKNGSVTYLVTDPRTGRTQEVPPRKYLNGRQERDFSTQPDLILRLAQQIALDFEAREGVRPIVRAHAPVSLNGRPAELLIDPTVDLASISDGLAKATWIRPVPTAPPIHLESLAWHRP